MFRTQKTAWQPSHGGRPDPCGLLASLASFFTLRGSSSDHQNLIAGQPVLSRVVRTILRDTQSVCGTCRVAVPAQVVRVDETVRLEKCCPEHGEHSSLLADDAQLYDTTLEQRQLPPCSGGCTASAGPTLLVEVTDGCNLSCPTCLTTSSPQGRWELSAAELESRLGGLNEGPYWGGQTDHPLVVRLSGGEPTVHPELPALVDVCFAHGAQRVTLETNGLRLAGDRELMKALARHAGRLDIDLQLDGFRPQTSRVLRGVDGLLRVKLRGLAMAVEHGLGVRLLTTLQRELNLDELGSLLRFGLEHFPGVQGWLMQPASLNGRHLDVAPGNERLTVSEIVRALVQQSDGMLRAEDFGPLTDADPSCLSLVRGKVRDGRLHPLGGDQLAATHDEPLFSIGVRAMMDSESYDQKRIDGCRTYVVDKEGACRSFCEHNVRFRQ